MLQNWFKIAIINYKKNWVTTLINTLGLTLGFTAVTLVVSHWTDEASYGDWNPLKNEIYFAQPYYNNSGTYYGNLSIPMVKAFTEKSSEVSSYLLINSTNLAYKMNYEEKSFFAENGVSASESFFEFFPYHIASGSYKNALKYTNQIAISTDLSEQLFGTSDASGKTIKIENDLFTISVVYQLPKDKLLIKPNFVLLSPQLKNDEEQWGNFSYNTLFKFNSNVDIQKAKKDFYEYAILERAKLSSNNGNIENYLELYGPNDIEFTRLSQTNLYSKAPLFRSTPVNGLKVMFGVSIMILLLSAINLINLKTAHSSQRAKEVGLRKAIGASRTQLIIQFMLESFLICFFAFILSIFLLEFLTPTVNKFLNKNLFFWQTDTLIYAFITMIIISILAGIIPALYLVSYKPIETLKGNFGRSKKGYWLRNSILGLQIIISSFFIICGILIHLQVDYMMNKDLGFNGNQLINIYFSNYNDETDAYIKYEKAKKLISQLAGVETVTYGEAIPPGYSSSSSNVDYLDQSIQAQHGAMDFNFLQTMGVQLLKGRWLSPDYSSDTINNAIVNEAFARAFGWSIDDALNKKFNPGFDYDTTYKIVGVVSDYNVQGLENEVNPVLFIHYLESNWKRYNIYNLQVKLSGNQIESTLKQIKKLWQSTIEPGYPFDYYFVDKEFTKTFEKYQKQRTLFLILNGIVLLVALLGLFALSALLIEQKLKTVAIKKTLGASDKTLVFDLTKQFLIITSISVIISMPISYYFMNEWLKDFAYRIDMPWWPYLFSLVVLLTLTFLVVSFKAYRATQVNLIKYLKYE